MCDFSLQAVKSRPAKVNDKLRVTDFNTGTKGFSSVEDSSTAVCLLPGTELAFDNPVFISAVDMGKVAIFRQVNKEVLCCHHDSLEFVNGEVKLLTILEIGQTATVLQLPAAPKTEAEAQDQRRIEFIG